MFSLSDFLALSLPGPVMKRLPGSAVHVLHELQYQAQRDRGQLSVLAAAGEDSDEPPLLIQQPAAGHSRPHLRICPNHVLPVVLHVDPGLQDVPFMPQGAALRVKPYGSAAVPCLQSVKAFLIGRDAQTGISLSFRYPVCGNPYQRQIRDFRDPDVATGEFLSVEEPQDRLCTGIHAGYHMCSRQHIQIRIILLVQDAASAGFARGDGHQVGRRLIRFRLPGAAAARQAEEQREQQDGRHYSLPSAAPMSSRMASTAALEASA